MEEGDLFFLEKVATFAREGGAYSALEKVTKHRLGTAGILNGTKWPTDLIKAVYINSIV